MGRGDPASTGASEEVGPRPLSELGSHTSPEVSRKPPLTLVIPLGATEQHGPHLPLDTDTRIAEAVAGGVAAASSNSIIGPTVAVGASGEHAGFPGTLSIGTETLTELLIQLVRNTGPEFSRVALINAHGGNHAAVTEAVRVCKHEGRDLAAWSVRIAGADSHAGRTETSLMLAIAPDHVRTDLAEAGVTDAISGLMGELRSGGLSSVTPNGVLGDPTGASPEEGQRLLAELIADAVDALSVGQPVGKPVGDSAGQPGV